jgi:hypothetical protein
VTPPDPGQEPCDEDGLDAGDFAAWASGMQAALRGGRGSDVPCDGCTACCTSSQFVHIGPEETTTLARIPDELRFPAPGFPPGHVVLGYDERGHCPMLIDDRCSIYADRPRTCRTYDCRVFAASGVTIDDDPDKATIAARAARWRFRFPATDDAARHEAVRTATEFLLSHADLLPAEAAPANATQRAVLAVALHDLFVPHDGVTPTREPLEVAREIVRRRRSA